MTPLAYFITAICVSVLGVAVYKNRSSGSPAETQGSRNTSTSFTRPASASPIQSKVVPSYQTETDATALEAKLRTLGKTKEDGYQRYLLNRRIGELLGEKAFDGINIKNSGNYIDRMEGFALTNPDRALSWLLENITKGDSWKIGLGRGLLAGTATMEGKTEEIFKGFTPLLQNVTAKHFVSQLSSTPIVLQEFLKNYLNTRSTPESDLARQSVAAAYVGEISSGNLNAGLAWVSSHFQEDFISTQSISELSTAWKYSETPASELLDWVEALPKVEGGSTKNKSTAEIVGNALVFKRVNAVCDWVNSNPTSPYAARYAKAISRHLEQSDTSAALKWKEYSNNTLAK